MGSSQERLAETAGLEALTLSRVAAGARALGLANLARVAVVLKCSQGDLIDQGRAVPVTEQPSDEAELMQHYRRLDEAGRKTVPAWCERSDGRGRGRRAGGSVYAR